MHSGRQWMPFANTPAVFFKVDEYIHTYIHIRVHYEHSINIPIDNVTVWVICRKKKVLDNNFYFFEGVLDKNFVHLMKTFSYSLYKFATPTPYVVVVFFTFGLWKTGCSAIVLYK